MREINLRGTSDAASLFRVERATRSKLNIYSNIFRRGGPPIWLVLFRKQTKTFGLTDYRSIARLGRDSCPRLISEYYPNQTRLPEISRS